MIPDTDSTVMGNLLKTREHIIPDDNESASEEDTNDVRILRSQSKKGQSGRESDEIEDVSAQPDNGTAGKEKSTPRVGGGGRMANGYGWRMDGCGFGGNVASTSE